MIIAAGGTGAREDDDRVRPMKVNTVQMPGDSLAGRAQQILESLVNAGEVEPSLNSRYLVKGWLAQGGLSVLFGKANVGKSFLALDIAHHVAKGARWNGCRVAKGQVLYIAAEGASGFLNRVCALSGDATALTIVPVSVNFSQPTDHAAIADVANHLTASREPVRMIVVDTLARAMSGDENTVEAMGAVVRNLDALRARTGAHLMLVHHSGKDASRGARGHSSLPAAVDTEISLTAEDGVIEAKVTQQRDMKGGLTFSYRLREVELGKDDDGDPVTTCVVEPCEPVEKKPKLSGQQQIALEALDEALLHVGKIRKINGLPSGQHRTCELSEWSDFCGHCGLSDGDKPDSLRRAFERSKKKLLELGIVREFNGFVWRTGK